MTDNIRYIGDVFIDGKTDALLREFLTNLFDQYNGEGKGFNADMLDGHHYSDIENELNELNLTKLSEVRIGDSIFTDEDGKYLLFSDVIYNPGRPGQEWMTHYSDNPSYYSLSQAFLDLYEFIINDIENTAALKVDKEKVDPEDTSDDPRMKVLSDNNFTDEEKSNLADLSEAFLNQMVDYIDENNITHHMFNAQLVNGLRFILITQDDYDKLPSAYQNYWRNVFIIRDPSEIPSSIDYSSPLELDLEDGYDFRVAQDDALASEYIVENDGSGRDFWLQLKHKWDDTWTNLMPLQDFLQGVDFEDEINHAVLENKDLIYDEAAVTRTVQDVLENSSNNEYTIDYCKDNFIHRISKDNVPLTQTKSSGFINVEIGNAFDSNFESINDKISNITNDNKTGTIDVQLNGLNNTLTSLNNQVNGDENTSIVKSLQSISNSIGQIQEDISDIKNISDNINNWRNELLAGYIMPKNNGNDNATSSNWLTQIEKANSNTLNLAPYGYNISKVKYNPILGLASLYLSFEHWHKQGNAGQWVSPSVMYTKNNKQYYKTWEEYNSNILNKNSSDTTTYMGTKTKIQNKPYATIVFPNAASPNHTFIKINPVNGEIMINHNPITDKNSRMYIYGQVIYKTGTDA